MIQLSGYVLFAVLTAFIACPSISRAQVKFDPQTYQALAGADSSVTIALGTKITLQNWTRYKQFLPIGLQAFYSGKYHWHIGGEPEYTITVAPTMHLPLPKKVIEDTEKNSGQVSLDKLPGEQTGYFLKNYVAGLAFPHPEEPNIGVKIMLTTWLSYTPFLLDYVTSTLAIDSYNNVTPGIGTYTQWRFSHVSDPGYPISVPYGDGGYLFAARSDSLAPEQIKYTVYLNTQPYDPMKAQEAYVYLPSLRRSLRLSTAARCSPFAGTDWVQDDDDEGFFFQMGKFTARLLGYKKVLLHYFPDRQAYIPYSKAFVTNGASPLPLWVRDGFGSWQLRTVYILDVTPLADPHYCYRHKVAYIDADTFYRTFEEMYDNVENLWKVNIMHDTAEIIGGQKTWVMSVDPETVFDMQNNHCTASFPAEVGIDASARPDAQRWESS